MKNYSHNKVGSKTFILNYKIKEFKNKMFLDNEELFTSLSKYAQGYNLNIIDNIS